MVDLGTQPSSAFIIGPIGSKFAPVGSDAKVAYEEALQVYEEVIKPACEIVGLAPVRADGLARAGEITEQIFRRLRDEDVVIADLTGANANVMYELGLRHTTTRLTVPIGEYGRLPFDISVIRTIQFSRSSYGLIQARDLLIEMLEAGLVGEADPVTATRVWADAAPVESVGVDEPAGDEDELNRDDEDDAPGFLERVAESEARQSDMTNAIGRIGETLGRFAEIASDSTEEIAASDARGAGMQGRLAVATRMASKVDVLAEELEGHVNDYLEALDAVAGGTTAFIEEMERRSEVLDDSDVVSLGTSIRGLASATRDNVEMVSQFAESMGEASRLSRVLRKPTRRLVSALRRMVDANQTMDEWDRRLQQLGIPLPTDSETTAASDLDERDTAQTEDSPDDSDESTSAPD